VGGVPAGLDRVAVSSWCNKKADVYGNFTKKLVSLEIGAQNRFALLLFCGRPSAKLNHFFRITPPSLTTKAANIADAHLAAAVAAITHTPTAFYQTGHPPLALRACLHAPVTASSHTASDGGGAGFASLRTIAPGAYLASFIDTLPHLAAQEVTAAYVSDPTSFSSSCSPALKEVAEHFTTITTNQYLSELALDWRTQHIHSAITDAPTPATATSIPNQHYPPIQSSGTPLAAFLHTSTAAQRNRRLNPE